MAVDLLRRAVAGGRVAHAYLFAGPAGVGKRLVALELARSLNCLEPRAGEACGACRSCLKLSAEPPVHPDVTVVEPEGRMIRTEQMRQVQNEVYARPTEGRYKVVIIDGAERMNAESGNRLLKVLEEPPPYACFVLLTTNAAGVLPTIVSRCQIVHFSPLPAEAIAAVLQEKAGIGPGEARLFASLSGGSVGAALAMAANPEVGRRRDEALSVLLRAGEMDDADLLEQAAAWEKEKITWRSGWRWLPSGCGMPSWSPGRPRNGWLSTQTGCRRCAPWPAGTVARGWWRPWRAFPVRGTPFSETATRGSCWTC
ncbi:MAG: hypothetical protein A6D92_00885 [Symbiobacterium thermophilum]|uniref:AAA+ ATPase domain-containing protein n=1 Tax=Symbiobacterium thermophilum TaxID=2734 RepID=A0A1Y2T7C2_SYMTR|nr:MAG: hypothetical protein A6D92_00885 [Symbiobacterium thermophilum]